MTPYGFALAVLGACSETGAPTDTDSAAGADDSATDDSATDDSATDDSATDDSAVPPSPTVTAAFTPAVVAAGESSQLDVVIENFEVVDPTGSPMPEAAPGEGHYHLFLDGEYILAAWTPFVTIDTSPDTALGKRVFRVALVDSEHNEIVPTVETEATLTIE
jgi:hypothetical protein